MTKPGSRPKCPYCSWPLVDIEPGPAAREPGEYTMCVSALCQRPLVFREGFDGVLRAQRLNADDLAALPGERMEALRKLVRQWRAENDA